MESQGDKSIALINEIRAINEETSAAVERIKMMNMNSSGECIAVGNIDDYSKKSMFEFKEQLILLDIGGEVFHTSRKTLLSQPGSLFYLVLTSIKFQEEVGTDTEEDQIELFFDRSPTFFSYILAYMRTKTIDNHSLISLPSHKIRSLIKEAQYYSLNELVEQLLPFSFNVKYIQFDVRPLKSNNLHFYDNDIDDLNNFGDRSLMKGICVYYNHILTLELERVVEFNKIEIGLYRGDQRNFSPKNGIKCTILTSLDRELWTFIGVIPSESSRHPVVIDVVRSKCKYIQFINNIYQQIGIGFCRVII